MGVRVALRPRHEVDPYELNPVTPDEPTGAPDPDDEVRYSFLSAGSFILDTSDCPPAVWGQREDILVAEGEATVIVGPQGTGKSTIAQQFTLGRCGFPEYAALLGFPVAPGRRRTLYLAMDRPRQIARSMRRMVGEAWRRELDAKLAIWQGPPPRDLAKHPSLLARMCADADADTVVIDSLKDAALGLSEDEPAAAWNRARQTALSAGVQVLELHHSRKAQGGVKRERLGIDDVYGSTWITSGAGSVILLAGAPGDPIVGFHHVKQPMNEVGPFKLLHDSHTGRTTLWHSADLLDVVRTKGSITAAEGAAILAESDKPTPADKEKARRKLDALTRQGFLVVLDEGDRAANRPRVWGLS